MPTHFDDPVGDFIFRHKFTKAFAHSRISQHFLLQGLKFFLLYDLKLWTEPAFSPFSD
jgi:hypothetical protein